MGNIRFKVTDDSVNRKGYIVSTLGIDATEYNDNNVLLFNHDLNQPIGIANYFIDNGVGFADVYFDEDDDKAISIRNKVQKGHLKTTSISIAFNGEDVLMNADGVPTITKSRLREISITPIPANKNAILQSLSIDDEKNVFNDSILYLNAELYLNDEVIAVENNIIEEMINYEQFNVSNEAELVEKFNLLNNSINESNAKIEANELLLSDLNAKLEALSVEKDSIIESLNVKASELEAKLSNFETKEKETFIDEAISEGKFNIDQRESLIKLSESNFDLVKEMISKAVVIKAPKIDIINKVNKNKVENNSDTSTWNFNDWVRKDYDGLMKLREEDKSEYDRLYNTYYKK